LVKRSFLSADVKEKYIDNYREKVKRMDFQM